MRCIEQFIKSPDQRIVRPQRPMLKNTDPVYAWVMNNFWETNFKASLGGFHNFRFALRLLDETDPEKCFSTAKAENTGLLCFPSFDVPQKDCQPENKGL